MQDADGLQWQTTKVTITRGEHAKGPERLAPVLCCPGLEGNVVHIVVTAILRATLLTATAGRKCGA